MAGPRKKKYSSGEGNQYWTRATALKKLQLSLKDFRRLCILKGIYPREPRNRKKAQRGSLCGHKILYHKKDIQFLMQEPIIWKFREIKVHGRKIGRAKAMKENGLARRLMNRQIVINLDHIIKERYPTFIDALKDMDDCLTICSLFATFPALRRVPRHQSALCRRLVLEFMQAIIAAKALRKVFISIKGIYYQVEIKGQLILWSVPHSFSYQPKNKEEVDFKIMSTFAQFYVILLGFVNCYLYNSLNLYYPPKIAIPSDVSNEIVDKESLESERIAALNIPLVSSSSTNTEEEQTIDTFNLEVDETDKVEVAYAEAEKIRKLKKLFEGMKVFLNREVPREALVFILRCFGAEVSWDKNQFIGATFDESDETITHQIVDRPSLPNQYISRYYVQPQWVFDSVNARELLPVQKYLIGAQLPMHLSPFVDETRDQYYSPPEAFGLQSLNIEEEVNKPENESENGSDEENAEDESESDDEQLDETKESDDETSELPDKKAVTEKKLKKKMVVTAGKLEKPDPVALSEKEKQEKKLREKMVEKKHRALYKSMMRGRAERNRDLKILQKKRILLEKQKRGVVAK